jgi:ornithine cyclodeaminase/alanine dehydrogenase-like protein (mu-crystallin family)
MALGPARSVLGAAAKFVLSAQEAISKADVIAIVTPWDDYAAIPAEWVADGRIRFIIDCWHQLDANRFPEQCKIVHLGHQETISAAANRVAAE